MSTLICGARMVRLDDAALRADIRGCKSEIDTLVAATRAAATQPWPAYAATRRTSAVDVGFTRWGSSVP